VFDAWATNQRYLMGCLAEVRRALEAVAGPSGVTVRAADTSNLADPDPAEIADARQRLSEQVGQVPALDRVCESFGLTPFERDILLLCAGMELDGRFPQLCAAAHGDSNRQYPTFGLALALFAEPAWGALLPSAPLRRWHLVELEDERAPTRAPLRIDERILHFLAGFDVRGAGFAGSLASMTLPESVVDSHRNLAKYLAQVCRRAEAGSTPLPVFQLNGVDSGGQRAIAALVCDALDRPLQVVAAETLPTQASELAAFIRKWNREVLLDPVALLIDCRGADAQPDSSVTARVSQVVEDLAGLILVCGRERFRAIARPTMAVDVERPTSAEQRSLWCQHLGDAEVEDLQSHVGAIVAQFDLTDTQIQAACTEARSEEAPLLERLWICARAQARPQLGELAQQIRVNSGWDDLVVPESTRDTLHQMVIHVRQRQRVNEEWGFGTGGGRGTGITALFAGPSGSGKTMAAEVLADTLRLDLFRIDLSAAISKYVGETEKNLRRIFDAADGSGAILLFDEADALFGKRTEVKEGLDRYANMEISYLLQRMEAYRGLAILTTNLEDDLDSGLIRRIRFILRFPFPDATERAEIWRRVFPAATPREGIDPAKLARLNASGGTIRNIAVAAACLAAAEQGAVRMPHVLEATRTEYQKLKRSLAVSEIQDWTSQEDGI
jgi:ATPase family protein associated with various cellular activities (AAA)/winged helix domain-containing protein